MIGGRSAHPGSSVRSLTLTICIAVLVLVGLQQPASGANPQFVRTAATLNEPVTFVDQQFGDVLFWAAEATLTFQLAGLGNNQGVTVSAEASVRFAAALASCPGGLSLAAAAVITTGDRTFMSDANGVVKGRIVLREVFAVAATSGPPTNSCGRAVRVAYDGLTLTVAGTTLTAQLGNLSGTFVHGNVDPSQIPPFPPLPAEV